MSRSKKGRCSGTPTTSFFGACEVSCRVRAERVKPYASSLRQLAIHPADLLEVRVGPPPPGATRGLGVFLAFCCHPPVYASQRTLSRIVVNAGARLYSPKCVEVGFSELPPYGALGGAPRRNG